MCGKEKACCLIGDCGLEDALAIKQWVFVITKDLIEAQGFSVFFFKYKNAFTDICFKTVNELKENYPFIKILYSEHSSQMIDESDVCVFFYDKDCAKSEFGTYVKESHEYALSKKKKIINIPVCAHRLVKAIDSQRRRDIKNHRIVE